MTMFSGRRINTILAAVFLCGISLPAQADGARYVLSLSWQPTFCDSDAGASKSECSGLDEGDWAASHFTLHGLWPNADRNGDGRLDEADDYCLPPESRAQAIAQDRADWAKLPAVRLPPDLQQRLTQIMPGTVSRLERHQWIKHGSCSGLSMPRYFGAAVSLAEAMAETDFNNLVAAAAGEDIARRDLLAAFATEFGKGSERALQLVCRKDAGLSVLSEVRLHLRADAVEKELSAWSLETGRVAKGSCPALFRIKAAN
ncbi:MAG: hypothetical protein IPK59_19650 [Rhodospirillaceae bacterium]|nr:hypothetical protein [Rhodospirillaceae bacterium]